MEDSVVCPVCGVERTEDMGKVWCPDGHAWDPDVDLSGLVAHGFTGSGSTSPRMEAFWATGDASAFDRRRRPEDVVAEHHRETRGNP